ncbi:MAG: acetyl-CoA decarbonylase/synthase complex subunit alpha/beta [Nitrospiraceae bacterium]|nr:acetyl-CoA decarbonylase/synthase complex subunit alpha/beta [Nitrospiraceae bacterium]
MSKIIAAGAIRGSNQIFKKAGEMLEKAIAEKGEGYNFEFVDTAFYLPMIYAMTGFPVKTLGDMRTALGFAKELLHDEPGGNVWLPYLGEALDSGMATLFAEEVWLAARTALGLEPCTDHETGYVYNGFITDTIQRNLGIQLVDGTMPGFAAIIGAAPDDDSAVKIVRELQEKNILTFLSGHVNGGNSVTKQLLRKGVELGWDSRIVPLGPETEHTLYALDWAIRASLIFGGKKPGDFKEHLRYQKDRVFAFALVLGELDDMKWATGAGAINMGFPAVADTDVPVVHPTGVCTYEEVDKEFDHAKIVQKAIEVRGLKIVVEKPPIPVAYGPAFEGERIRKEDMFIEFGGQRTPAFEWVRMKEMDEVEDGKVTIVGENWKERYEAGGKMPFGLVIDVAGRKMQKDFESVIERKIHHDLNEAQGIWHMGQRDLNWVRISNNAKGAGITLEHLGVIFTTMMRYRFRSILDKVQVTIYVDEPDVKRLLEEARKTYKERDERLTSLTDESVDIFYSCLLCQSFAPSHVCVITPERLGLCGAYNWLDGKAAYEIDPTGGNQPITKGSVLDNRYGRFSGVDEYLQKSTGGAVETLNLYTIMENPMTSCGCFECIVAIIPEANGVMIVQRGHQGMTPVGMKFSTLAGSVGGGMQTPGFMGVGRNFITSKKFLAGDGGLKRIVWMTKNLKESLKEALMKRAAEEGVAGLLDKIADEDVCEDSEKLLEHLAAAGHPALEMDPIIQ